MSSEPNWLTARIDSINHTLGYCRASLDGSDDAVGFSLGLLPADCEPSLNDSVKLRISQGFVAEAALVASPPLAAAAGA